MEQQQAGSGQQAPRQQQQQQQPLYDITQGGHYGEFVVWHVTMPLSPSCPQPTVRFRIPSTLVEPIG